MLVILGSLFLPFASRMASQAKEVEMLSTEELQRNQQLISQIYTTGACGFAGGCYNSAVYFGFSVRHVVVDHMAISERTSV